MIRRYRKPWFHALKEDAGIGGNLVCAGIYRAIECLMAERVEKRKFGSKVVEIQEGQGVFGKREIAEHFGLSPSRVQNHITTLEDLGKIQIKVRQGAGCLGSVVGWKQRYRNNDSTPWYSFHRGWVFDDPTLGNNARLLGFWDYIIAHARYSEPADIFWNGQWQKLPIGSACINLINVPHHYGRDLDEYGSFLEALAEARRIDFVKENGSTRYLIAVKTWHAEQHQSQNRDRSATEQKENNRQTMAGASRVNGGECIEKKKSRRRMGEDTSMDPYRSLALEDALEKLQDFEQRNWEAHGFQLKVLPQINEKSQRNLIKFFNSLHDHRSGYLTPYQLTCFVLKSSAMKYREALDHHEDAVFDVPLEQSNRYWESKDEWNKPSINNIFNSSYQNRMSTEYSLYQSILKNGVLDDFLSKLPKLAVGDTPTPPIAGESERKPMSPVNETTKRPPCQASQKNSPEDAKPVADTPALSQKNAPTVYDTAQVNSMLETAHKNGLLSNQEFLDAKEFAKINPECCFFEYILGAQFGAPRDQTKQFVTDGRRGTKESIEDHQFVETGAPATTLAPPNGSSVSGEATQ